MASAHAQLEAPTSMGALTAQISYDWQSATVLAPEAQFDDQVTQKAYGLLNGRVAMDLEKINGTLALYGRNILDKRSEEHTSELQSLMRISYAVFCLKKTTQAEQI